MDNPLDAVYAYAEQAYIRMQAGDVLMRCLDQSRIEPMHELVETLVLAGPQSIGALSEILAETGQRRAQMQDDLQRLAGEMKQKMTKFGLSSRDLLPDALSLVHLSPQVMRPILENASGVDRSSRQDFLHLIEETQELTYNLTGNIHLLKEIEEYIRDWLWGLAHESAQIAQRVLHDKRTEHVM